MILAAPGPRARPKHAVPPRSFAELSCQKIVFDLQLTNLAVQKIDLRLADRSLCRAPPPSNALANSAILRSPLTAASVTFALNAALCFFRVCFMSCSRAIGAFYGQGSTLANCLVFGVHLRGPKAPTPPAGQAG